MMVGDDFIESVTPERVADPQEVPVMGFPHPSHPKETVVLSKHFGDAGARSSQGWVERGGYEAPSSARHAPDAMTKG